MDKLISVDRIINSFRANFEISHAELIEYLSNIRDTPLNLKSDNDYVIVGYELLNFKVVYERFLEKWALGNFKVKTIEDMINIVEMGSHVDEINWKARLYLYLYSSIKKSSDEGLTFYIYDVTIKSLEEQKILNTISDNAESTSEAYSVLNEEQRIAFNDLSRRGFISIKEGYKIELTYKSKAMGKL